jgi:hypothetical protein
LYISTVANAMDRVEGALFGGATTTPKSLAAVRCDARATT